MGQLFKLKRKAGDEADSAEKGLNNPAGSSILTKWVCWLLSW